MTDAMTDANQPQSHAERTGSTKLGDTVGQHDRSGDVYPPDEPLVATFGDDVDIDAVVAAVHEIPSDRLP